MNNEKPYHLLLMKEAKNPKKSKEQKMKETFIITKTKGYKSKPS
jgi:hypothetical protein